jgi:hypothetical protein
MVAVSVLPRLRWAVVVWVLLFPSAAVEAANSLVVQQIGDMSGPIAEAVGSEVTVVPLSRDLDPRTMPIVLAPGKIFVRRGSEQVAGLRPAERSAIRQAYDAGQVILLLDASTHDIEALHRLVDDGVAHESSTDPVVLAYALRKENNIPTARLVTYPVKDDLDQDGLDEDELALSLALETVVAELTRPSAAPGDDAAADSTDWGSSPVQAIIITSTDRGTYNTPIELFALHSCQQDKDYYLVSTGGTWTPQVAHYESAHVNGGQVRTDPQGNLHVDWQDTDAHCTGGIEIAIGPNTDERICRYMNYPLSYKVDIVPQSGPTVVQVNAAPAGDQGESTSYTSGFAFSIGGGVDVSGDGPSGGIQAGVTWDNSVTTTVPSLVVQAGNQGNQGTFTRYLYCTTGNSVQNCTPTIQMTGPPGLCQQFVVGRPQQGQTPNGRLSNVAQTVNWQVDPGTYTGSTFDVTVTWQVELATSTSQLWVGPFRNHPNDKNPGPSGYCNVFGCSCGIASATTPIAVSHTFKVPRPSTQCSR